MDTVPSLQSAWKSRGFTSALRAPFDGAAREPSNFGPAPDDHHTRRQRHTTGGPIPRARDRDRDVPPCPGRVWSGRGPGAASSAPSRASAARRASGRRCTPGGTGVRARRAGTVIAGSSWPCPRRRAADIGAAEACRGQAPAGEPSHQTSNSESRARNRPGPETRGNEGETMSVGRWIVQPRLCGELTGCYAGRPNQGLRELASSNKCLWPQEVATILRPSCLALCCEPRSFV